MAAVSGTLSDADMQQQIIALRTPVAWPGYNADSFPYWYVHVNSAWVWVVCGVWCVDVRAV